MPIQGNRDLIISKEMDLIDRYSLMEEISKHKNLTQFQVMGIILQQPLARVTKIDQSVKEIIEDYYDWMDGQK